MKTNAFIGYEELTGSIPSAPRCVKESGHGKEREKDIVVCPKPRRVCALNLPHVAEPFRPLRWQFSNQQDVCDAKAGAELLDIILAKGGYGGDQSSCAGSPPPFFTGSPPSRVSNPLIQDARFGDEKAAPVSPRALPVPAGMSSSPNSSARKAGGCVRANFGNNPAVRVEGFDCLDRDRRNCSIPALA